MGGARPALVPSMAAPDDRGRIQLADGQVERVDLQKPKTGGSAQPRKDSGVNAGKKVNYYRRFQVVHWRQPRGFDLGFLSVSPVVVGENQVPVPIMQLEQGIGDHAV